MKVIDKVKKAKLNNILKEIIVVDDFSTDNTRNILKNQRQVKKIKLKAKRFDFEPEIISKILKNDYKIKEVDISFLGRKFKEGKKTTWKDGLKALFYLIIANHTNIRIFSL